MQNTLKFYIFLTHLYRQKSKDILISYPLERKNWEEKLSQLPNRMYSGEAHFIQDEPVSFDDGKEHRLVDMLMHLAAPLPSEVK